MKFKRFVSMLFMLILVMSVMMVMVAAPAFAQSDPVPTVFPWYFILGLVVTVLSFIGYLVKKLWAKKLVSDAQGLAGILQEALRDGHISAEEYKTLFSYLIDTVIQKE